MCGVAFDLFFNNIVPHQIFTNWRLDAATHDHPSSIKKIKSQTKLLPLQAAADPLGVEAFTDDVGVY